MNEKLKTEFLNIFMKFNEDIKKFTETHKLQRDIEFNQQLMANWCALFQAGYDENATAVVLQIGLNIQQAEIILRRPDSVIRNRVEGQNGNQ